jgi:type I restriction enzyme S subunit
MAGRESTIGALLDETGGSIKTGPFGTKLKASEYTATGVPVISVREVGFGRLRVHHDTPRVDETVSSRMPEFLLNAGDIVFGRKGAVERSAQVQPDEDGYFLGSDGIRIRLNVEECDPKFISYQLQTTAHRSWMIQHAAGTTMPSLNEGIIRRIPIVLPPLAEQKAIAAVLGALDDKIELNRRMNATLEAMARALFQSWFVDFDPVRAKLDGRQPVGLDPDTAALFPDSFQDSSIGHIPTGWEVAELGNIADVIDCLHAKKPDRCENGQLYLQLNNIRNDGLIDITDSFFVSVEDYRKWISRMEARAGDCVITNVGRVGAVGQIPEGVKAALGRNITGIRCKSSFPFATFLIECLVSESMREEIRLKTDSGTILDALNVKSIPKLRFVRPIREIGARFDSLTRPLRRRMEQNLSESRILAILRDTLLPKLLSGEMSVADVALAGSTATD